MNEITFFVPVPNLKMVIQANRPIKNYGFKQKKVSDLQAITKEAWEKAGAPHIGTPVRCVYAVQRPTNIRYDPANWQPTIKAMIDVLVHAGALEEDNKDILQGPDPRHHGKGELGVWLRFTDWEAQ